MKKLWRTDEFTDLLQGFVEAHEEEWRQELLQFEQRKASLLLELEKDTEDVRRNHKLCKIFKSNGRRMQSNWVKWKGAAQD